MNMIEVKNLLKKFGQFTAVDQVSFTVTKGDIFGFLGPIGYNIVWGNKLRA